MNTTATQSATVQRIAARSGNRDADYFQAACSACDWRSGLYSNRTIEGRRLAARDTLDHNVAHHGATR